MRSDQSSPNVLNSLGGFFLKLLGLSLVISVLITRVGPLLPIPQTDAVALIFVLSPTVLMAVLLGVRSQKSA